MKDSGAWDLVGNSLEPYHNLQIPNSVFRDLVWGCQLFIDHAKFLYIRKSLKLPSTLQCSREQYYIKGLSKINTPSNAPIFTYFNTKDENYVDYWLRFGGSKKRDHDLKCIKRFGNIHILHLAWNRARRYFIAPYQIYGISLDTSDITEWNYLRWALPTWCNIQNTSSAFENTPTPVTHSRRYYIPKGFRWKSYFRDQYEESVLLDPKLIICVLKRSPLTGS